MYKYIEDRVDPLRKGKGKPLGQQKSMLHSL